MGLVDVKIDTTKLSQWAQELSERGFRNALRRAIDSSARAARKLAIDAISKDIGVSKATIRSATPKVRTTTAGSLSATFTVTKLRIGIMNVSGASISKSGGLHASTHRLTGGGSSHLDVSKAFLVTTASGGKFVAFRKGKERLPLKGVYAEMPNTALGQDGSAPQKIWKDTANKELATRLQTEIQRALVTEGLSPNTPDTGD
jgi:CCR4-NOT transcriptional regulation complex NOT5 subunit